MRVVYVDILFLLNLTVDYLLLLLTAKVSGVYAGRGRLLLGAAVGAVLAVALYFPPMPLLPAVVLRAAACCLTVLAAFGRKPGRKGLRLLGVFLLLTLLLAGLVLGLALYSGGDFLQNGVPYFAVSLPVMGVSFLLLWLLSGLVLGKGRAEAGRSYREVTATMGERTLRFRALADSGNLLRDPLSGQRIIILQAQTAARLFDGPGAALLGELDHVQPEELLPRLRRCCKTAFWLLPVHTAVRSGLVLVFRPEGLFIDGVPSREYLLGLTAQALEIGGDCHGLMGV